MRHSRTSAGMHRLILAGFFLLAAGRDGLAQDAKDREVLEAIKNHFKTVTPEFWRYKYLRIYGDTLSGTALTQQQLERERALFKAAASTGLRFFSPLIPRTPSSRASPRWPKRWVYLLSKICGGSRKGFGSGSGEAAAGS